ncbi:MAG: sugar transferase [Candidatus Wildermuthbacteria bacterium]|nr:sugar transferase [Candidatus Wildermuthbacteria bacterium]
MAGFQRFLKRLFDFIGALVVFVALAIPFFIIAIFIRIDSKGPVFFLQERVGKNGKIFTMLKFRTMVENAVNLGRGIEVEQNDFRITRVGGILRRFSIDELPQLLHILRGEMSFVGPRPALPHQVAQYSALERKRLLVQPGIANMAMLKGWNTLPWKERIRWDIWYIEHWSLFLDLKVLFYTAIIVLLGKGQYGAKGVVEDYK